MDITCSTHGGDRKCLKILVGKTEGKRSLGNPNCIWEVTIEKGEAEGWNQMVVGVVQQTRQGVINLWAP
jgi:hypothetical protein